MIRSWEERKYAIKHNLTMSSVVLGLALIAAAIGASNMDFTSKLAGLGVMFLLIAAALFLWRWD